MMEKSSVWILIVDGLCLAVVGIPILVIKYAVKPTQLGFYCSDRSLYSPYHSSTVPTSLNLALRSSQTTESCQTKAVIIIEEFISKAKVVT